MNATIEIDGLRKRFGPVQALDGMTFTVQPGHVTGFVGPNGAGKSTTVRVVVGLDAPDAGHALVGREAPQIDGEDTDGKKLKLTDYRGKVVLLDFWGNW